MGRCYGQLSLAERIEIYRLHGCGHSLRVIAEVVGRSPSTVSRELRRNGRATSAWPGGYDPLRAERLTRWRRKCDKRFKLARQPDLRDLVRERLAMGLSPEQVAGRLTREYGRTIISHESIYRYVYHRSAIKDYWNRLLPHKRKRRRSRSGRTSTALHKTIMHRLGITQRPVEAAARNVPGHWEADTMLFSQPGQTVLVTHERATRYTCIQQTENRKAATTAQHLTHFFDALPATLRRTLTVDNGGEFARHYTIGIATYFCDKHAPWQKGGIENAIGRLRRKLPRKTNLETLNSQDLQAIVQAYNNTPRKCLDFQTPAEAFLAFQSAVALQV
jgi:transposase, IS30 family